MSDAASSPSVDMIRWTFTVKPENRAVIEAHLVDLGPDVVVLGDSQFHISWEEHDLDLDEIAAELWDLNEEAFEITQEEFHRVSLAVIHPDEEATEAQAA